MPKPKEATKIKDCAARLFRKLAKKTQKTLNLKLSRRDLQNLILNEIVIISLLLLNYVLITIIVIKI